jgi:hypothetical protein
VLVKLLGKRMKKMRMKKQTQPKDEDEEKNMMKKLTLKVIKMTMIV